MLESTENPTRQSGRQSLIYGTICCGLGVALGAFGAHALAGVIEQWYESELATRKLENWETAVRYQVWHGLALIGLGIAQRSSLARKPYAGVAAGCFLSGIVVFSGGLYLWVLSDLRCFAIVVPIGGLAMLTGWLAFFLSLLRRKNSPS